MFNTFLFINKKPARNEMHFIPLTSIDSTWSSIQARTLPTLTPNPAHVIFPTIWGRASQAGPCLPAYPILLVTGFGSGISSTCPSLK